MIRLRARWFAWWYLCIAIGFVLLAINRIIAHDKLWLILLRLVIAAGFAALSAMEFKTRDRRGR